VLAAEEHTLDVHREQRVPIRLGRVHDGAGESVAGIVDQDLEAAIPLGYPFDQRLDFGLLGDVHGRGLAPSAARGEFIAHASSSVAVAVGHYDKRALGGEEPCHLVADSGPRARDDRHLAVELHVPLACLEMAPCYQGGCIVEKCCSTAVSSERLTIQNVFGLWGEGRLATESSEAGRKQPGSREEH